MTYFNDNDSFYSASTTPNELDPYPFLLLQTLATVEETYSEDAPTFAGSRATVDQLGYSAIASTSLFGTPSYGAHLSKRSIDPCFTSVSLESTSTFGSLLTPLVGSYWPNTSQSTEPDHPGTWSRDDSFAGGQGWETTMSAFGLNSSKYHLGMWKIEAQILTTREQSRQIHGVLKNTGCQLICPTW